MKRLLTLVCFMAMTTWAWCEGPTCTPPFLTSNFGIDANDVGTGQDGTTWAIGSSGVNLVLRGSSWTGGSNLGLPGGQPSSIGRVSAGPDGSPWAVDNNNHIWHFTTSWQEFPGLARDIAVTPDGTPWVIGTLSTSGGFHIYFWNGSSWVQVSGAGERIAGGTGTDLEPYVVNSSDNIFHRNSNGTWSELDGLGVDIALDFQDTLWVLGNGGANGGGQIIWHHSTDAGWVMDPNAPGGISITGSRGGVGGEFNCGAFFVSSGHTVEQID